MADLRIPPSGQTPAQVRAPQRADAARAAQKAFFDAARGATPTTAVSSSRGPSVVLEVTPAQPVRTVQRADAPAAARATSSATAAQDANTPQRLLRPGSIIDIKV